MIKEITAKKLNTEVIDARVEFFAALKGFTDPEQKREAITQTFYRDVFGRIVRESGAKQHTVPGPGARRARGHADPPAVQDAPATRPRDHAQGAGRGQRHLQYRLEAALDYRGGLSRVRCSLGDVKPLRTIAAGIDPVALDAWALGLFPTQSVPASLGLAAEMGLGRVDYAALGSVELVVD